MNDSHVNGSEVTPGLAIAAAELYNEGKTAELLELASVVNADMFTASSIQLSIMIIDWIALNEIGDAIAKAYEEDDQEKLAELHHQGARYSVTEDGTLSSWLEYENGSRQPFDFPLDFWTTIKFSVQAHAEDAAHLTNVPLEVINHLTAGIINDGIIKLLSGDNEIAVPTATNFYPGDTSQANYAVVAANAFITSSVLSSAARHRTNANPLEEAPVTYEQVADIIRESLRDEMLSQS